MSHYQKAQFLLSAAEVSQLPPDEGIEIAIVGRSNAGKSSVLNKMTNIKGLARVSKTPGRTQMINIFVLDANRRIADLPGYGFAKVPLAAKRKWEQTIDLYINERQSLRGLVLVMDIRHLFKELDVQLLEYCSHRQLPVHLLLNKCDKLSNNEIAKAKLQVKTFLAQYHDSVTFQVFSALRGVGLKDLHSLLNKWYEYEV